MHPPLKKGFSGKRVFQAQSVQFPTPWSGPLVLRGHMFWRLTNSEKWYLEFKTHPNIQFEKSVKKSSS